MCGELRKAIIRGLADHASKIAERLLENMTETEIIDECIVPSLDNVSKLYDSGEIFLPQMLKSSDAAGAAFDILRKSLIEKYLLDFQGQNIACDCSGRYSRHRQKYCQSNA